LKREKLQEMEHHRGENVDIQHLKQNHFLEIRPNQLSQYTGWLTSSMNRGADKSLARPGRK